MKKIISDDIGRIETFIAYHLPDIAAVIVSPLAAATLLFFFDWGFDSRIRAYHQELLNS
ncbi:hypothetical protein ACSLVK_10135 [Photorhabdus tasmaniensis]|uniref:hypothetical protein n=1 Tax=Photorhabdus tasmaniensis TaxID=1004159 RepID=UPI0040419381